MVFPSLAGVARADFDSEVVSKSDNLFEGGSVITLPALRHRVLLNDATGEQILDIDHLLDPSDDNFDGFTVFTVPLGGFITDTGITKNALDDVLITRTWFNPTEPGAHASMTVFGAVRYDLSLDRPGQDTLAVTVAGSPTDDIFNVVSHHGDPATGETVLVERTFAIRPNPGGGGTTVALLDEEVFATFGTPGMSPQDLDKTFRPDGTGALVSYSLVTGSPSPETHVAHFDVDPDTGTIVPRGIDVAGQGGRPRLAAGDGFFAIDRQDFFSNPTEQVTSFPHGGAVPGDGATFGVENSGVFDIGVPFDVPGRDLFTVVDVVDDPTPTPGITDPEDVLVGWTYTPEGREAGGRNVLFDAPAVTIQDVQFETLPDGRTVLSVDLFDLTSVTGNNVGFSAGDLSVPTLPPEARLTWWADPSPTPATPLGVWWPGFTGPTDGTVGFGSPPGFDTNMIEVVFEDTVLFEVELPGLLPEERDEMQDDDRVGLSFDLVFDQPAVDAEAWVKVRLLYAADGDGVLDDSLVEVQVPAADADSLTAERISEISPLAADAIDAFADGAKVEFEVRAEGDPTVWIDNLAVWVEPVPEPASLLFVGVGVVFLAAARRPRGPGGAAS
jgi:hypothetical protein